VVVVGLGGAGAGDMVLWTQVIIVTEVLQSVSTPFCHTISR
jgi:hypothetical protein